MINRNIESEVEKIKRLILKSLLQETSKEDIEELNSWREESPLHKAFLEKILDDNYLEKSVSKTKIVVNQLHSRDNSRRRARYSSILKAASIILLLFASITFLVNISTKEDSTLQTTRTSLSIGRLGYYVLSNNSDIEKLAKKGIQIYSDTIDYSKSNYKVRALHTLHVPKKRSFTIKFADGSIVKLNSESTISFTGRFKNEYRDINLSGEAYFEITKIENSPFIAKTELQEVLVRGTSFNIKAYPYEKEIKTTLVDGSVCVNHVETTDVPHHAELKPGQQYIYEKERGSWSVKEVDVYKYISWKDGVYYFDSERLEDIMNNISRWYGLTVMYKSEELKDIVLSGRLKRVESPSHILRTIGNLKSVEIIRSDNHIIIKRKQTYNNLNF